MSASIGSISVSMKSRTRARRSRRAGRGRSPWVDPSHIVEQCSIACPITVRRRLSADDRRRQLVGIGLRRIVDTPIQDLSLDQIAAEAGISRGLLFHYFPTKTDFYLACIAAAGRRILRNTAPGRGGRRTGPGRSTMVTAMIEQIDRRRAFYLTLVHGSGVADPRRGRGATSPSARSPPTG